MLAGVDLCVVGWRRCYLIVDLELYVPGRIFVAVGRLTTLLALYEGKSDHNWVTKGLEHALLGDKLADETRGERLERRLRAVVLEVKWLELGVMVLATEQHWCLHGA